MAEQSIDEMWSVERLDHLVNTDPSAALTVANDWRRAVAGDATAEAKALSAIARAYFELGRSHEAADRIREALALSASSSDRALEERIAMSGAAILGDAGDVAGSLAVLDRLEAGVTGDLAGRIATQRAYVLHQAGELTGALEHANRAEPLLRDVDDRLGLVRLLVCRGLILLQRGELAAAEGDLRAADTHAAELQQTAIRAVVASNLGVVFGRGRRIPEALAEFGRADDLYALAGRPGRTMAVSELDRAEVLMHAGLVIDAARAAAGAVRLAEPSGNSALLGDAQLLLARAHHAAGEYRSAQRCAQDAEVSFAAAGRTRMVSHARSVRVHAGLARAADVASAAPTLDEAGQLVGDLTDDGWGQLADELRVARVRTAWFVGLLDVVGDDLDHLRAGTASERRDVQLAGWYATAIGLARDGDTAGAIAACKAGLDLLDDIVVEATTLERRSAAMRLGADLSRAAIDLAVAGGSADVVLSAADGTRARALHDELVQPGRHHPLTDEGAARLRGELREHLPGKVLVEWVIAGRDVWAVVCAGSQDARLARVAGLTDVLRARDRALVWLDRATQDGSDPADGARRAMDLLDEVLVAPLDLPPDVGVVVVPDGPLHAVPWSGLPSLVHRPLTLSPNAQMWLQVDRRAEQPLSSVAMVVGPDVAGERVERAALRRHHRHLTESAGAEATAEALRRALSVHDLVHVAAHGSFRSDHPLLSTLRLVGGEATLYDVIPDNVASQLVVLSSCEAGVHGAADGSEVLGFAAVMLARGAAAVLAPTTTVDDVECGAFVAEVHGRMADGAELGAATADVRRRWWNDGNLAQWAVASSFTCYGSVRVRC